MTYVIRVYGTSENTKHKERKVFVVRCKITKIYINVYHVNGARRIYVLSRRCITPKDRFFFRFVVSRVNSAKVNYLKQNTRIEYEMNVLRNYLNVISTFVQCNVYVHVCIIHDVSV